MNYGRDPESGFVGQKRSAGRGRSDLGSAFNGGGNSRAGFLGARNSRPGRDETGFEGLQQQEDDPRDFAQIGNFQNYGKTLEPDQNPEFNNPPQQKAQTFKRVEKPLTHIDRDTVGKVVELKDKYQKLKDRSTDKQKEMKVIDMKIDALADRIRDIDKKKNEFKDQLFEEKKKNHLLKKRLDLNEQEKLDLEQQLETGIKPTRKGRKGKGVFGNVDIESHQQMLEEKRRKEREEMRRQLFVGIDFLGGGQLKVSQSSTRRCCEVFKDKIFRCFDALTPHRGDLQYISAKYDKATTALFQFFRFVVAFSIIMFFLFIFILTVHTIDYAANNSFVSPEYCNNIP